jgi:hypothetical protein
VELKFEKVEQYRVTHGKMKSNPGDPFGLFFIPSPNGRILGVIASAAYPETVNWDHVSVSTKKHTPTWNEMCFIKNLFFDSEECVIQFHPPKSVYINDHSSCLHLWRPAEFTIPLPPLEAV